LSWAKLFKGMFQLGEWHHRIGSTFCLRCTIVPNSCHQNNIVRQSFLPVVFHRWSCRNPFGPSCPLTKWHQWLHWFWQIEYHIRKELFRKFQHHLCSSIVLFVFWQRILQRWHHHNRHISCIVSRFCKFGQGHQQLFHIHLMFYQDLIYSCNHSQPSSLCQQTKQYCKNRAWFPMYFG